MNTPQTLFLSKNRSTKQIVGRAIAGSACTLLAAGLSVTANAQAVLEEITVTAQKRTENIMDVPISISSLSEEELDSKFSAGESILALASAAPGLYAESSNGRHSPRFYMRGLGNADFSQAASQPVSVVFDEVPMELVVLKAFPIFDVGNVEVIRGPQGTLYGRNTTAGILKLNSRRPTQELDGYARVSAGSLGVVNVEGAVGGPLVEDTLTARFSAIYQNRDDYVNNGFTGESDALGGYREVAGRVQFEWTPTDNFSALLLYQQRDLSGNSASVFRANILDPGSNELNGNFDRDTVWYDGGGNNPAEIEASGTTLQLNWNIGAFTLTSITAYHEAEQFARGDIDGGVVDPSQSVTVPPGVPSVVVPFTIPAFGPALTFPGEIFISSDTAGTNDIEQFTQELRFASDPSESIRYQIGAFFFDDELITVSGFGVGPAPRDFVVGAESLIENKAVALFAQADFDLSDQLTLTAGIRWTDDEKDYTPIVAPPTQGPVSVSDSNVSGNLSLAYALNDSAQIYGRIATGFRAPSIQARDVAFGGAVSTATSETINSYEFGYKADISDRVRLNAAVFHYEIDDMQLTAVGGIGNFIQLLNSAGGSGTGIEFDLDIAVAENLTISGGFGYADTEIEDPNLSIAPCFACTVTDPINIDGNAVIDGNPFQHAPLWTLNADLSYVRPLGSGKEFFFYTDWKAKGKTNEFLYESIEFEFDTQFEGGLRVGYRDVDSNWSIAVFGRNITDEENPIGGIDFTNNTSYVNEPRIWGVEAQIGFGD